MRASLLVVLGLVFIPAAPLLARSAGAGAAGDEWAPASSMEGVVDLVQAVDSTGRITGRVLHPVTATPLSSVQVLLVSPRQVTTTNERGEFLFLNVPTGKREVTFTLIGYNTVIREVEVAPGGVARIEVVLEETAIALDEIVVTGRAMGTARREIGTSVSTINTDDLELAPIADVSQLLQSRIPGMTVMQSGGNAGQGSAIVMRGPVSLTQSIEPIIYVDGVRLDNSKEAYVTVDASWTGLDDIDPAEIERIEVVKGAAAATLYGTEASAGVIQIFTKRGKDTNIRWNLVSGYGLDHTPREWWDISVYSPWFYENFVRTGRSYYNNVALSGGASGFSYRIAGNLSGNEGVLVNSSRQSKIFRANMSFAPSERMSIDINNGYYTRKVTFPEEGSNNYSYALNALAAGDRGLFYPSLRLREGSERAASFGRYTASVQLSYRPTDSFTHRLVLGTEVLNEDTWRYREYGSVFTAGGLLYNLRRTATTLNLDYTARFQVQVSPRVRLGTAFGMQAYSKRQELTRAQAASFAGPGVESIHGGASRTGLERRIKAISAGYFGEQQVAFADKMFVTFGLRADGHSAFGESLGYQLYPKVDVSYMLSEEGFWPQRYGTLRLRGAYGTAGRQPTAYASEQTWQAIRAMDGLPGFTTDNEGNPNLSPEVSHEFEAGFDYSVGRGGKLSVEYTFYNQNTKNALYNRAAAPSAGFLNPQLANIGEVHNRGHELLVAAKLMARRNLLWNAKVNLATNRNKVVSLGDAPPANVGSQHFNQWIREGYPAGALFGDRYEMRDGQLVLVEDVYLGPPLPTLTLGLSTDLRIHRNFTVNVLVDYKGGHKIFSNTMRWLMNAQITQGEPFYDPDDPATEKFKPGLPVAHICRGDVDPITEKRCSEEWTLHRGDYVYPADIWRLRELGIGYRLPASALRKIGARSALITLSARNLWRHQKYPGLDAESKYITSNVLASQSYFDTPHPRQFTARINLVY